MSVTCPKGKKPRYRYRPIKGGKQRLTICGKKTVVEVKTIKNSVKKKKLKKGKKK